EDDWVLHFGFPIGQFAAFLLGIEAHDYDEAVGRHGNPSGFATAIRTVNGHGDYWVDPIAANAFLKMIDPTIAPLPLPSDPPSRALAPQTTLPPRQLPSRALPKC